MMLIACPHCGPRAQSEFVYERTLESVIAIDARPEDAIAILFQRENPRGASWEVWRHSYGCRAWMKILRHTVSHRIEAVEAMGE